MIEVKHTPTAFRYDCIKAVGDRKHLDPPFFTAKRANMNPRYWTETPLYEGNTVAHYDAAIAALKLWVGYDQGDDDGEDLMVIYERALEATLDVLALTKGEQA
jgi:hypothetical protein